MKPLEKRLHHTSSSTSTSFLLFHFWEVDVNKNRLFLQTINNKKNVEPGSSLSELSLKEKDIETLSAICLALQGDAIYVAGVACNYKHSFEQMGQEMPLLFIIAISSFQYV